MPIYKLKKKLGSFNPGLKFEGSSTQRLSVLEQDENKVFQFKSVALGDTNYFKELKEVKNAG